MGNTWVLATASVEEKLPPFMEKKGSGWITAEYAMLPRSTHTRSRREVAAGKPTGRTQEIQRLIGRSLRACVNAKFLGERTFTIDCDVIQADGGTRTASINAGYVALNLAVQKLRRDGKIKENPFVAQVGALSLGLNDGQILVDLDYEEDVACGVDMNFVLLSNGELVELQGTAERGTFKATDVMSMLTTVSACMTPLFEAQARACLEPLAS